MTLDHEGRLVPDIRMQGSGYVPPQPSTGDPPNYYFTRTSPSIQEQMGTDPMSKLAAAINRLCDILEA